VVAGAVHVRGRTPADHFVGARPCSHCAVHPLSKVCPGGW
jgi:hypothetical protein